MEKAWAGRGFKSGVKHWGVAPANKIYSSADGLVTCACGKTRQLNPAYVAHVRRQGQTQFSCGDKKCAQALRTASIVAACSTESCKQKHSNSSLAAWDKRGRAPRFTLEFTCETCGTVNKKTYPRGRYLAKLKRNTNRFCNASCRGTFASMHNASSGTKPELKVAEFLTTSGIIFTPQKPVCLTIPGCTQQSTAVDFMVGDKLAIFVDGCYWHFCPVCKPNQHKKFIPGRDAAITSALQSLGYTVLRIWEHELKDPTSAWQQRLLGALK